MTHKKKLSKTQLELLEILKPIFALSPSMEYDTIKRKAEFKSFDSSFNALLVKKHIARDRSKNTNNFLLV